MRSPGGRRERSSSKRRTSPPVRSRSPATTEMSVVLPQPLGPTRNVSSPRAAVKSTPLSTSTRASPSPKCLRTSRHSTAVPIATFMDSPPEHDGGFEHEDTTEAHEAREDHDEQDAGPGDRHALPHQDEAARGEVLERDLEESGREPRAQREAEQAHGEGLEEDHPEHLPVGDAHGLQGGELLQVLEREEIERLARHHDADDERDPDRDAEVDRNARVLEVVPDAIPAEFVGRPRPKARATGDPPAQLPRADAR